MDINQTQLDLGTGHVSLPSGVTLKLTLGSDSVEMGRIAWSPDGQILALPSVDTVGLWDYEKGKCVRTLREHDTRVTSVAFDSTSGTLATGSSDSVVKLWKVATGKLLRALTGHRNKVNSVAWYRVFTQR